MVPIPGQRLRPTPLPPPWGWGHGLVLRRQVLGEEDLRLEILFLRRGILEGLVRRGALSTTPQKGALEPPALSFFHFQWVSPQRVRLRQWEEARSFSRARRHPALLLEMCHTLSSLLPRAWWDPGLFRVALKSLRALEAGQDPREVQLLFRLGVLETTGHSPWHLLQREGDPHSIQRSHLERVVKELWQELLPISTRKEAP